MTFRLIIADNLKVPSLSTYIRHVLRLAGNTRCVACGFTTVEHSCISYSAIGKGRTVVRQQYTGLIALDIGCRELPIDKLHVHIRVLLSNVQASALALNAAGQLSPEAAVRTTNLFPFMVYK